MSKHLAQIGVPGQLLDVLAGGDVDTAGRLLTVAELQTALGLALQRSRPDVDHRTDGTSGAADSGTSPPVSFPTQDSPIAPGPTGGSARPVHAGRSGQEHPTVPAPEAGGPDPTTPAAGTAAAVDAVDEDAPGPPPQGERGPEWGANPAPVSARPGQRPVRVAPPAQPAPSPGSGRYWPVGGRDRGGWLWGR